ncbi:MAG: pyridoxamine 5'-phosphate oxidase family protein [bacterium]
MPRKDREIKDLDQIIKIIEKARVCRLSLFDQNYPYTVPLCFGYKDKTLYFHSALRGKKIDIIKKNKNAGFEIDIPGKILKKGSQCNWDIEYHSVIGYGKAEIIKNPILKKEAIKIILNHYSFSPSNILEKNIKNTNIIKLDIKKMTGKKSI